MFVLVFLLVLLAIAGLLGAVLKALAFLILAAFLGITALAVGGYLAFRHAMRSAERELDRHTTQVRIGRYRRSSASAGDPGALPNGRDDRY